MSDFRLVADIGNTNIVAGVFNAGQLIAECRLKTDSSRTCDEYDLLLGGVLREKLGSAPKFSNCAISSVVPAITPIVSKVIEDRFKIKALVVGPGIKTGLSVRVPDPASVGTDRIVNAVAAKNLFGAPALIVDFGTATSFDYLSAAGNYEGGIIAPGPAGALDALVRNTAKLPRIDLSWPDTVIGNGTVPAMQSGVVIGYQCLVDGLIDRVVTEKGPIKNVIATGGLGRLFSERSPWIKHYDPQLTLKGLNIIADLNAA